MEPRPATCRASTRMTSRFSVFLSCLLLPVTMACFLLPGATAFAGDAMILWKVGSLPPDARLDGENGGKLDGTPWDYKDYLGRIHLLFYVDPDAQEDGEELANLLDAEKFPGDQVHSSAIVNMKATNIPNFLIEIRLSAKQKRFPNTTYAKDFTKHLVKEWGLKDDAYNFLILNQKGELIHHSWGKPTKEEIAGMIALIRKNFVVAPEKPKG
ncbi:transcriptional regulator [bacterium]|nr:transcriptional regulator [bacterium]